MEVENPMVTNKTNTYQHNKLMACESYRCKECGIEFNSCENGVGFEDESYCDIDCLMNNLLNEGLISDI